MKSWVFPAEWECEKFTQDIFSLTKNTSTQSLMPTTKALDKAATYRQWVEAAQDYDRKARLTKWKSLDRTSLYDFASARRRLNKIRKLRTQGKDQELLFALNEGIHGNLGGMGKSALYKKAMFGTKDLVRDYNKEVASALQYLADDGVTTIPLAEKLDFFERASHCFGRTALLLSGAGTLLFFHFGVVKALWSQGLLPKVISGASGGAVVAALVGTHADRELENIFDLDYLKLEIEKEAGLLNRLFTLRGKQITAREMRQHIDRLIPDMTFQEAYQLTGIHINISIAPVETHQKSRLLNAITTPNALIREAVQASCAAPGFVAPVTLAARNVKGEKQPYLKNQKWVDGSVSDDLPVNRLSRLYGANHFVVSQTNPIVLPFVDGKQVQHSYLDIYKNFWLKSSKEFTLASARAMARLFRGSSGLSKLSNIYLSILSQNYSGDITILPKSRFHNPLKLLEGKSREEILELFHDGEKATWPNIEQIRIQTIISRTLDSLMQEFDQELIEFASQAAVRKKRRVVAG